MTELLKMFFCQKYFFKSNIERISVFRNMSTDYNKPLWTLFLVDMTGHTLDYRAVVWPHQENLTLPSHPFQHFGVAIIPRFDMLNRLLE